MPLHDYYNKELPERLVPEGSTAQPGLYAPPFNFHDRTLDPSNDKCIMFVLERVLRDFAARGVTSEESDLDPLRSSFLLFGGAHYEVWLPVRTLPHCTVICTSSALVLLCHLFVHADVYGGW